MTNHMEALRPKSEYEGNPVGIGDAGAKEISNDLDKHLASYVVQWAQYHKYHWMVEGPQFRDLHLFLQANYEECTEDLDAIAERITLLGCTPSTTLQAYAANSYCEEESEDVMHIRDSLKFAMDNETKVCNRLRKTIKLCLEHDDYGTKKMIEGILERAENRAHHLEHFLGHDSLVVGYTVSPQEAEEAAVA